MRLLALLVAVVLSAALVSGCGSDDLGSVSAADAAAATRDAETARIKMQMSFGGMGVPQGGMDMTAEGVTAVEGANMDVTFDVSKLMAAFGAGGDGKVRVLIDGGDAFVEPPQIPGLDLPGDATWVTADLPAAAEAMGIDAGGAAELMRFSTEQQLDALSAAGSVKKVGEEEIDGENTVHMKGTVKLEDYLRVLPAERRKRAEKVIEQIEALPGGSQQDLNTPTPIELWVDGEDRVRRIKQSTEIPAQQGVPAGSFAMTIDFSDFGTELNIDRPEGDEVWDATDQLTEALRRAG